MRFKLIDRSANGTCVALDGTPGEARVLRGATVLHGSGRISLGRPVSHRQTQSITFRRDLRAVAADGGGSPGGIGGGERTTLHFGPGGAERAPGVAR
jgi:hypothetical protein